MIISHEQQNMSEIADENNTNLLISLLLIYQLISVSSYTFPSLHMINKPNYLPIIMSSTKASILTNHSSASHNSQPILW